MKERAKIFLAGFAAGLFVLLLVAYTAGHAQPGKRTRTTLIWEAVSTNSTAPVEMKRVVH